jgi:DNA-binding PadR family transcriptional regulator
MTRPNAAHHQPLTPPVLHVLLALAEGALHGYAIMQRVEEESGIEMGPGTVYGSLRRMERDGLVEEVASPADEGEARRRYYALTRTGHAALRAEAVRLERVAALARARVASEGGAA